MEDESYEYGLVPTSTESVPKWYVKIGGGIDLDYGVTDFNGSFKRSLPNLIEQIVTVKIRDHGYDDIYDTNFYRFRSEVGYAVTRSIELWGLVDYTAANGQDSPGGFIAISGIGNTERLDLTLHAGEYNSYGLELGVRCFLLPEESRLRPYVSFGGGPAYIDSTDVRMIAMFPPRGAFQENVLNGSFYDSGWTFTASVVAGVEVRLAKCFSLGIQGGARYQGTRRNGSLARNRLAPVVQLDDLVDDRGNRFYCPLTVYAKFRF